MARALASDALIAFAPTCPAGQMEQVTMSFTNEADDFSAGQCVNSSRDILTSAIVP
jgi:hypothetical protein